MSSKHSLALNKLGDAQRALDAVLNETWLFTEAGDEAANLTRQLESAKAVVKWLDAHCGGIVVADYKRSLESREPIQIGDVVITTEPYFPAPDVPETIRRLQEEYKKKVGG